MKQKTLNLFVIYENPLDYPGKLVVRRWVGQVPDEVPMAVTENLEVARNVIPDYCIPIGRYPDEDPAIKEVWI